MLGDRRVRGSVCVPVVVSAFLLACPGIAGAQGQSFFQGSVPTGQATRTTLNLSLSDAFARALR